YVSFLPAEGGTVTGWVSLQYMDVRLNNDIISLPELQAEFGQYTGEPLYNIVADDVVGTVDGSNIEVSIPTPDPLEDAIVGEVILDAGSNLQLRRQPDATSESINLIPTGTRVIVDNRTGNGDWISVTFEGETGWVAAQYVSLSFNGQLIDIADVPVVPGEEDEIGL
ncbi:MAG: SH3 domain-containing protein, partial [Aggregatilineales bacterium]